MSDVICRRAGCRNTLSDDDAEQGFEHCSSACYEAGDDLDPSEYDDKLVGHVRRLSEDRDIAQLAREEHEGREDKRRKTRKLRGNHKREKKNPKSLRAQRSAGKLRRPEQ